MKWIILSVLLGAAGYIFAQNEEDALRYSQESLGGTARNMSMAGAMTAIGGDYSSTLKNPAATGRFSKNNFSFTSFVESNNTGATFDNQTINTNANNLKLGNFSYLKAYNLDPKKYNGWLGVQLGVGYNRKQSFNQSFTYTGNSAGSMVDYFIAEAGEIDPDLIGSTHPYSSGLAYDGFLIDPFLDANNNLFYSSGAIGESVHTRTVTSSGGMGEVNFSISGNYKNKLLVGGSFNIVTVNYDTDFTHNETFDDTLSFIEEFDYTGSLDVNGTGINARVGLIYIPEEFIRIGASIETPSRLALREISDNSIRNQSVDELFTADPDRPNLSEFIVRTPLRANFSLGLVSKKLGSIGAELEIVDYSSMKMRSNTANPDAFDNFIAENNQIDNLHRTTFNFKLGAEARVTEQLYLRGGYARFGSPYKPEKGVLDNGLNTFTGGIGYNFGGAYLDFATVLQTRDSEHIAYLPEIEGATSFISRSRKQFVLSFGYRF